MNKKNPRPSFLDVNLSIPVGDPYEGLKQLCKQGKYRFRMTYDKFQNGIMMKCELFYYIGRKKINFCQEARFIDTDDLSVAREIISGMLLEKIGLYEEDIEEEEHTEEFAKMGMRVVSGMINEVLKGVDVQE